MVQSYAKSNITALVFTVCFEAISESFSSTLDLVRPIMQMLNFCAAS
jgi:hypothetical protein